ncbi:hypothetical protein PATSB16_27300 [Pandoraea thiooxydans]|uniref:3-phosphoglycerate dehydrogenase n=1 Tax=Pandoraea thiooxydans TaxID=445709 RepID=A0A0G3ETI1_9BURK|nr:hydroxyacid dehydrogenase [Pandoraea thiooxydans]AKJ68642.1 3-phosphoglycerate dehydrogenase [Pandoraea thiooxydans]APR96070.1 hypothetical protein PATSB16_27300 [Pandoraea thiooxydans]
MPKIVISEFMDDAAVAWLSERFTVHYDPALVDQPAALATLLSDADALIVRNRTQVTDALLAGAPHLRVVGRLGVGLDNLDLPACAARRVEVAPATGANARAVAEYVIASALLLLRGAYRATEQVAQGAWPRTALSSGREVAGKTLGVVGFGGIGQLSAHLAHSLGMSVLAYDALLSPDAACWQENGTTRATLDDILGQADVVTLHVPLTPQTRHLIDAARLDAMKPGAILINTARGGVVDEAALAAALRSGRLGGAALDVFEDEPLAAHSALAGAPNLLLTPHIAGLSHEANQRVSTMVAQRVAAVLNAPKPSKAT